jgi:pSer/pThr/pTyr-binding forkhead associated (FHA) protein
LEEIMATQTFQLTMQAGPNPGKVFSLDKAEISIGRDENRDIFILDSGVSRKHAHLTMQGNVYTLEDLGSTNGTYVNGQRLTAPKTLQPNDVILLGDKVRLLVVLRQDDPEATVQAVAPVVPPSAPPRPAPQPPPPQPGGHGYSAPAYRRPAPAIRPQAAEKKLLNTPVIMGAIGCVTLLCIGVLLALWYIDANYLWCTAIPFIPGCP